MRARVILNPSANRGLAGALADSILKWSNEYGQVDLVTTDEPGHGRRLAEQAVDKGYDLVLAAGGDGTVHEVVNGIVHGGRSQASLGVIPIGSGNDFAYSLGILTDAETSVRRAFSGQVRMVDMARIEDEHGRYELIDNGVGIGFDATVGIQSRTITRVRGFAMYLLAVLRTIALYFEAPNLEITFDDEEIVQQSLLLAIGVGPRAGGGFFLTPDARCDDDLLDSCTVNPVGRLTMLWMLPKVMRGTHITSRHVTMRRNRFIDVRSDLPLPIHIDGEIFAYPQDNVRRVTINSLPASLAVVVD